MIEFNAAKGLGDAIYLRAVVLHFLDLGEEVTVYTLWPEVFCDLPVTSKPLNDMRGRELAIRHVAVSGYNPLPEGSDDFKERCKVALITEPVKLRMDWVVRNQPLLDKIKVDAAGRKIFIYQPTKKTKNHLMELLRPYRVSFNRFVADHSDYYRIKLGHPPFVEEDKDAPCELDMYGKAFILDTLDICTIGDLFFGEICFMHTVAEAMGKNVVIMFSRAAQNSSEWVRHHTPDRLFHDRRLTSAVYDDYGM